MATGKLSETVSVTQWELYVELLAASDLSVETQHVLYTNGFLRAGI